LAAPVERESLLDSDGVLPDDGVSRLCCSGSDSKALLAADRKDRMNQIAWRADPLVWGRGSRVFEVFLEPTCPFSVRAFGKLDGLLAQAGEDRITIKIRLQSQPWHMYSGVIVRCILAASTLESGKESAKAVMAAVAAHREEFEFDHHCAGANLEATPNDIIRRVEGYSGVELAEAFAIPDLDREIKWHCRYARQNGIHVSPTFMTDGLVQAGMSSGDTVADWVSRLLKN
jgi:predicted DsbA family dithiol-disulfide isomerase